jgi:hypothetical protein
MRASRARSMSTWRNRHKWHHQPATTAAICTHASSTGQRRAGERRSVQAQRRTHPMSQTQRQQVHAQLPHTATRSRSPAL